MTELRVSAGKSLEKRIREIVSSELENPLPDEFDADDELSPLMDSFDRVHVAVALEDEFGIRFRPEVLTEEMFESLRKLAEAVATMEPEGLSDRR